MQLFEPYRSPQNDELASSVSRAVKEPSLAGATCRQRWFCFGLLVALVPILDIVGIAAVGLASESWTTLENLWLYCFGFPVACIALAIAVLLAGGPRLFGGIAYAVVCSLATLLNFKFYWGIVAGV